MLNEYLKSIKNDNTRAAVTSLIKKIDDYLERVDDGKTIYNMTKIDIDLFLKRTLDGKSNTTVASTISRLKDLFKNIGRPEVVEELSLSYVQSIICVKRDLYLSPAEIKHLIDSLINYQDKALVLLVYMGLYDNDFETIRMLREEQFKGDRLILDDGREIELNEYCSHIIRQAIKEDTAEKYIFSDGRVAGTYTLNMGTGYIFKTKFRKGGKDILTSATLKKRFDIYGKVMGYTGFSAICVKNSRIIYDLVKLEYEKNFSLDINQIELKSILRENNIKGTIELLNMKKKVLKDKIINEIINGQDSFII